MLCRRVGYWNSWLSRPGEVGDPVPRQRDHLFSCTLDSCPGVCSAPYTWLQGFSKGFVFQIGVSTKTLDILRRKWQIPLGERKRGEFRLGGPQSCGCCSVLGGEMREVVFYLSQYFWYSCCWGSIRYCCSWKRRWGWKFSCSYGNRVLQGLEFSFICQERWEKDLISDWSGKPRFLLSWLALSFPIPGCSVASELI